MKAKVFFSREITPEKVVEMYRVLGVELRGRVAVKVHSGEKGNQNFLRPDFFKPMVDEVKGTIVECNTAYGEAFDGVRDYTESHRRLIEYHGWSRVFDVDLMDAEGPDLIWSVDNGKILKENRLGKTLPTTTPCWCWRTSRATRWAATAARSSSCRLAAPPARARR